MGIRLTSERWKLRRKARGGGLVEMHGTVEILEPLGAEVLEPDREVLLLVFEQRLRARGSSVFALSERRATSEAARWLAKKENDADLVGGVNLDVKDRYLAQTLLDLSQTATIDHSLRLGSARQHMSLCLAENLTL